MVCFSKARNVVTGEVLNDVSKLNVEKHGALVFDLIK
jgi:hypothetical protein